MILEFSIFKPFSDRLSHGVTTKTSDPPSELIFGNQVHGDNVIFLSKKPDRPFEGDAFVTQKSNVPLAVQVADCQGVLMFDPKTQTIAAIHSGWRGSSLNITGKTIETMREVGGEETRDQAIFEPNSRIRLIGMPRSSLDRMELLPLKRNYLTI